MNAANDSDTSSVEILKTLTTHLASPLEKQTPDISPMTERPRSSNKEINNQLDIEKLPFVLSDSENVII